MSFGLGEFMEGASAPDPDIAGTFSRSQREEAVRDKPFLGEWLLPDPDEQADIQPDTTGEGEIPTYVPQEARLSVTGAGRKRIATDEGRRNRVYKDSEGLLTIGVGFNLEEDRNVALFQALVPGVDIEEVKAGRVDLDDTQVDNLYNHSLEIAEEDAREVVPSFDALDPSIQDAIVNMAFNLGRTRLGGFKKMLAAIEIGDGAEAKRQALDSKWARQVKGRASRIAQVLATLKPSDDLQFALGDDDGRTV